MHTQAQQVGRASWEGIHFPPYPRHIDMTDRKSSQPLASRLRGACCADGWRPGTNMSAGPICPMVEDEEQDMSRLDMSPSTKETDWALFTCPEHTLYCSSLP